MYISVLFLVVCGYLRGESRGGKGGHLCMYMSIKSACNILRAKLGWLNGLNTRCSPDTWVVTPLHPAVFHSSRGEKDQDFHRKEGRRQRGGEICPNGFGLVELSSEGYGLYCM